MTNSVAAPRRGKLLKAPRIILAAIAFSLLLLAPCPWDTAEATTAPVVSMTPMPASAMDLDPCALVFNPLLKKACEAALDGGTIGIPTLPTDAIGSQIASSVKDTVASWVAASVADGLNSMMTWITQSTVPDLTQNWALKLAAMTLGFDILLAVTLFNIRNVRAVKNRDPGDFTKGALTLGLFIVLAPAMAFGVTSLVKQADGPITAGLLDVFGKDMNAVMKDLIATLLDSGNWQGALLGPILIGLAGVLGSIFLLVMFFFRMIAVYLFTYYTMYTLALAVGGEGGWQRFLASGVSLLGLIFFKPLTAFIMVVAVMVMGDASHDSETILYGSMMLLTVPLLSYMAWKKLSGYDPQLYGRFQSSTRAMRRAISK